MAKNGKGGDPKKQADFNKQLDATKAGVNALNQSFVDNQKNILGAKNNLKAFEDQLHSISALQAQAAAEGKKAEAEKLAVMYQGVEALQLQKAVLLQVQDSYKNSNSEAQDLVAKAQDFIKKLPGGGFISKMFGLDKLGKQFENHLNKNAQKFFNQLKKGGPMAKGMGIAFKAAGGLLVAGFIAAVAVFSDFEKKVSKVKEDLGVSHAAAKVLYNNIKNAAAADGILLATTEDTLAVTTELANTFGNLNMITPQIAAEVADIGASFGYGAQQAGQVQAAFTAMGAEAGMAADMQRQLAAESLKAGVNVGAVMKDIAENSAEVAVYFGGNVQALKDAALQAAKLGVSLKTMASVSEGLLDFEKSIAAQFELQALTGKTINLDLARQKALQGDIAGATAAVLDQVGSIHDFNNMDFLARKKLAEATGMSVDELQKSLIVQDKLGTLTADQAAAMNNLGLSAAEMENMSASELQNRLAQQAAQDKLNKQIDKLKATLISAIMPAAEALFEVFDALSPLLQVIGGIMKVAFMPITLAAKGLKEVVNFATEYYGILIGIGSLLAIEMGLRKKQAIMDGAGQVKKAAIYTIELATSKEKQKQFAMSVKENAQGVIKNTLGKTQLGQLVAQSAQKAYQLTLSTAQLIKENAIKTAMGIYYGIQLAINVAKGIANALSIAALAPLAAAAGASIAAAIPSIFTGLGMIPFGIGIPIAIAAVAGMIAMIASMSKGDDVISKGTGGSGYGSRVLFGPEGAISFNNKDTIVAGTDLFRANDAMFAPKGALKMNDGAVGDMPDPPEAKIVGITADSVAKLVMGFTVALSTALPMAFGIAFTGIMPLLSATIMTSVISGAIAAAYATSFIPKPVLLMNPFVATFETNPVMLMGSILGGIFGGGGGAEAASPEEAIIKKLDDVIFAIQNMNIEMDGAKVGVITRIADSFRRR